MGAFMRHRLNTSPPHLSYLKLIGNKLRPTILHLVMKILNDSRELRRPQLKPFNQSTLPTRVCYLKYFITKNLVNVEVSTKFQKYKLCKGKTVKCIHKPWHISNLNFHPSGL